MTPSVLGSSIYKQKLHRKKTFNEEKRKETFRRGNRGENLSQDVQTCSSVKQDIVTKTCIYIQMILF